MALQQIQGLLQGLTTRQPARTATVTPLKGPDRRPAMLALHDGLHQCVTGDMAVAIETFQRAYILYRQSGDKRSASLTQKVIGLCFDGIKDPVHARKAYDKAIRLLQIAEMPDEVGRTLMMLARFEDTLGDHREAVSALRRALVVFREIGCPAGLTETLCQYAEHELERGRRSEAFEHGRTALEYVERIDDVNTYEKLRHRVDRLMAA